MNEAAMQRAVELREAGLSTREISRLMEIPQSTIVDWVKGIVPLEYVDTPEVIETDEDRRLKRLHSFCARCHQQKPWAAFWAAAKHDDGTMQRPQAWCRDCVKARRRERRKENPEWAREQYRREWERIQADPEKAARRREIQRENSKVFRLRRAEEAA